MDMTPMIDVTFLLLIFFMCTLKFKTLEGKLAAYLPKDVGVNPEAIELRDPVEVTIRVLRPGTRLTPGPDEAPWDPGSGRRYEWSSDRELEYTVGPWSTRDMELLESRLQRVRRDLAELPGDPPRATMATDAVTTTQDVMSALDRVIDAGFTDVTFAGAGAVEQ